jgi:hypothetical protein
MALKARNIPNEVAYAIVAAHNQALVDNLSTLAHLSQTESTNRSNYKAPTVSRLRVTAANGTDEDTAVALVNDIKGVLDRHFVDDVAHDAATSAVITIDDAEDEATAITLANDLKAKYNTHLAASNVHYTDDTSNDVTNANATDDTTLYVVINEMKADVNAHLASAPAGTFVDVVPA